MAVDTLAPLVPRLERALSLLRNTQRVSLDQIVARLNRKRKLVDRRHDCSRIIY